MAEIKLVQSSSRSSNNSGSNETAAQPPSSPKGNAEGTKRLDRSEFSVSRYVDRLFPDDESLENIETVSMGIKRRHQTVVREIRQVVHDQSTSDNQRGTTMQGVEATKAAIDELYTRISEMRAKARTSERMVLDITQDIKALDFAKRNLTHTTATMRRLQLFIGSVEQLRRMKERRMYGDAAKLVPAVDGLREGFAGFSKVKPVAALNETARGLQRALGSQAYQDVERAFDAQHGVFTGEHRVVHDACLCLDALGDAEHARVIDMYCELQLRSYSAIFQLDDDVSQLENISRRYAWLRRILRNYTEEHASLFPDRWRVGEVLSRKFSVLTRDHLGEIMATRDEISVEHLMTAMSDTMAFEVQCNKKFNIVPHQSTPSPEESDDALANVYIYEDSGVSAESFTGLISCAFEPYMSIFIRAERTKFDKMVAKFQQVPVTVDDDPSLTVLSSSTDLLYQFRESLRQCAALSTGQAMVDLSQVFNQCLCTYARDVLAHKLPRISSSSSSAAAKNSPSLLDDLKHVCLIVNTADYCASVAGQLEQKIVERVNGEFKTKVTFTACREALLTAINTSIRVLVSGVVDTMCDSAFATLAQVPWQTLHMVGDQSSYVMLIVSAMEAASQTIRQTMSGTRYFRSFCDKFASRFIEKYVGAINKAGPISEVGAEQLLLDAQALKSALQDMPILGETVDDKEKHHPPAAYTRIVVQGVGKIEAILKAILAPSDPPDALVDRFLLLFPAAPKDTFQQILSLKGIRPAEHHVYSRILRRKLRDADADKNVSTSALVSREVPNANSGTSEPAALQNAVPGSVEGGDLGSSSMYSTPEPKDAIPRHVAYGMSSSAPLSSTRLHQQLVHQRSGLGKHSRLDSNASSSSSMVFGGGSSDNISGAAMGMSSSTFTQSMTARRALHADPLGITGAEGSRSPNTAQINRAGRSSVMSSPGARQPTSSLQQMMSTPVIPSNRSYTAEDIEQQQQQQANAEGNDSTDSSNSPVFASLAANATATRTKLNENFRKFMNNMRRN
ncbi:Vacuolar protein sorting-associated protein 53 [Coemansia sp. RSA 986]|nr:Vacuolar protein sorting-associated protein 53 [Coemansia sp. RSA 986]